MSSDIRVVHTSNHWQWPDVWLDAWVECCDKALANFLLAAEFGTEEDARVFLDQFKRAKKCAIENIQDRQQQGQPDDFRHFSDR